MRNNLPQNLDEAVEDAFTRMHNDEDNVAVIGGLEGAGKSNFGIQYCNAISPDSFDLTTCVAYEPEEFIRKVKTAPRYSSIDCDEGGESFMAGDATTVEGKNSKKTLQQCRRKNLNVVFLAPRHFYLNKTSLFRCHAFFYIYKRGMSKGYGIAYAPVTQVWQEGKRPWFEKLFYFRFPDLKRIDKDAWDTYTQLKNQRADQRLDRYADQCLEENRNDKEMTPELLTEMIQKVDENDAFALRNTRGRIDANKIYVKYRSLGVTERLAQAVCLDLNANPA